MDLDTLTRTELRTLAKEHGVNANLKNKALIEELRTAIAGGGEMQPEAQATEETETATEVAAVEAADEGSAAVEANGAPQDTFTTLEANASIPADVEDPEAVKPEPVELAPVEPEAVAPVVQEAMPMEASMPEAVSLEEVAAEPEADEAVDDEPMGVEEAPVVPAPQLSVAEPAKAAPKHTPDSSSERKVQGSKVLSSLEAAKRKREEDLKRDAASAARREAISARHREVAARLHGVKTVSPAQLVLPSGVLPRVAGLPAAVVPHKPTVNPTDRFGGVGSIYQASETPSALAYAEAIIKPVVQPTGLSFACGPADRFAGHESRYKKGLRQSTLPIHDPKVYQAKQVDESVPLPSVATLVTTAEKREIQPSNERFVGSESIYNASVAPAPGVYDTSAKASTSVRGAVALDKQSERFVGHDTHFAMSDAPAVGTYDTSVKANTSTAAVALDKQSERFVGHDTHFKMSDAPAVGTYDTTAHTASESSMILPFNTGNPDRFGGPDSRYKKGLRMSTVPHERDPSSFPKVSPTIAKSTGSARGAALKAALKATINANALASVPEGGD